MEMTAASFILLYQDLRINIPFIGNSLVIEKRKDCPSDFKEKELIYLIEHYQLNGDFFRGFTFIGKPGYILNGTFFHFAYDENYFIVLENESGLIWSLFILDDQIMDRKLLALSESRFIKMLHLAVEYTIHKINNIKVVKQSILHHLLEASGVEEVESRNYIRTWFG